MTTHTFPSHDGAELFYRAWLPYYQAKQAIVIMHRGHEHSGRMLELAKALEMPETAMFAWDQRGHGESPGPRGGAENLGVVIRDVEEFFQHIEKTYAIARENIVLVAHSVGAVVAAAWVHDYAPRLRGLVLATPAFRVKLYVPMAVPMLRAKEKLMPGGVVKSYVKSRVLTHDPAQQRAYDEDKAIFKEISVNILLDLFDTAERVVKDAAAIRVPTLVFSASQDWVVHSGPQREFFERLGASDKEFHTLYGFYHAIFHEAQREVVFNRVRAFAQRLFTTPPVKPGLLLDADQRGHTRTERDELAASRDCMSSRVTRLVFGTLGRLSKGIALGWDAGFDSGRTLDYVYKNKPSGKLGVGWLMDKSYLDSPGWTGIRWRGQMLQRVLADVLAQAGEKPHLVDIACGGGRYILQTLHDHPELEVTATLRDYQQPNLDTAKTTAEQLGLTDSVNFMQADAFDRSSLATLNPPPTVAVVSGLYELFNANAPVLESLKGLADAMAPGTRLVYTNQPWHPQLKFIAHVLTNREGQPWIMRRRTQEEMDDLVRAAGFVKERQETDPAGIFTISVARKL
ncbi:alpha-beta hydrolase superfamily lysophospholipase [Prosthecobacter fusiformis]|uniref:Alpha-beta hydrolase superfamily lysophospholipase n=1 Tax=Prosthecobacter fusiformis TaxID=48464 RepID=A0A4R7RWQ5_9BACT|nr:bifunctional alpha/beta hydrolase/class I SAM-dependent methyltransferase [Prosthecobacter fusiformis]TDU69295.1 alpha-beta hydrolase superfamily lysophospholipase [Prosthecobacter fusiformis]